MVHLSSALGSYCADIRKQPDACTMERMNQMPWEAETTGREALLFLVIEHRQHGAPVPLPRYNTKLQYSLQLLQLFDYLRAKHLPSDQYCSRSEI